jgi:hypothetical protein
VDPIDALNAVDGRDVGMIERGQRARLALEARQPFRVAREDRRKNLDGDVAAKRCVARAVDLALCRQR